MKAFIIAFVVSIAVWLTFEVVAFSDDSPSEGTVPLDVVNAPIDINTAQPPEGVVGKSVGQEIDRCREFPINVEYDYLYPINSGNISCEVVAGRIDMGKCKTEAASILEKELCPVDRLDIVSRLRGESYCIIRAGRLHEISPNPRIGR